MEMRLVGVDLGKGKFQGSGKREYGWGFDQVSSDETLFPSSSSKSAILKMLALYHVRLQFQLCSRFGEGYKGEIYQKRKSLTGDCAVILISKIL